MLHGVRQSFLPPPVAGREMRWARASKRVGGSRSTPSRPRPRRRSRRVSPALRPIPDRTRPADPHPRVRPGARLRARVRDRRGHRRPTRPRPPGLRKFLGRVPWGHGCRSPPSPGREGGRDGGVPMRTTFRTRGEQARQRFAERGATSPHGRIGDDDDMGRRRRDAERRAGGDGRPVGGGAGVPESETASRRLPRNQLARFCPTGSVTCCHPLELNRQRR